MLRGYRVEYNEGAELGPGQPSIGSRFGKFVDVEEGTPGDKGGLYLNAKKLRDLIRKEGPNETRATAQLQSRHEREGETRLPVWLWV